MFDFVILFWKTLNFLNMMNQLNFLSTQFAYIFVLGHKSIKQNCNKFSKTFHHACTLNLKLCHMMSADFSFFWQGGEGG